jgi:uncharacterized protein YbcC (UPF0753/DUF2309 family)
MPFWRGSKITHNITGKFAVVQGNGGDIKWGFPSVSNGIRLRNVPPATAIICRHTGSVSKGEYLIKERTS